MNKQLKQTHKNKIKPKSPAFSSIEILLTIIVISLIVAALVPVLTKKLERFRPAGDRSADVEYYAGEPRSQEDCDYVSKGLLFVKTDKANLCISKYNISDYVFGTGLEIQSAANVTMVKAGESCGTSTAYDTKCCWQGKTAGSCDTAGGYYSGCKRTVCTWAAANAICNTLGMRLMTQDELTSIYNNYSKDKKNAGAQFCDYEKNYGSSNCVDATSCIGSPSSFCSPNDIWSTEADDRFAYEMRVKTGSITYDKASKSYAQSVRCALDRVQIGHCEGDECGCGAGKYLEGTSCKACTAGYYCDDGETKTICPDGKYSDEGAYSCSICPAGYYCKDGNKTKCPDGEYSIEGETVCSPCPAEEFVCKDGLKYACPENCKTCTDENTCSVCKEGYALDADNKCSPDGCKEPWQMQVEISGVKYCVTKFNVGDYVNGVGVDIPTEAGVTTVSAGQTCGSSSDYFAKCCWQPTSSTSTSASCGAVGGGAYSGCSRTVCTWPAAAAACSALGMRVLLWNEFQKIYMSYSKSLADEGIQLCDSSSGYGSATCGRGDSRCPGAHNSQCFPSRVWSMLQDYSYGYTLEVSGGTASLNSNSIVKSSAQSVRCIVPKAATGACTVSECGCSAGYYTSGDACKICEAGYYCTDGTSKSLCASGKSTIPGATKSTDCFTCPDNCVVCSDSNTCTQCKEGYELTSDGKCQRACPYSWQMPVKISNVDYCFTKYNVGDFVNGVGVSIPSSAGVTMVKPGETCGSETDYTAKCCWVGTSLNHTSDTCDSAGGSYSGCYRTVCNWVAADMICSALNMRLATTNQLPTIYSTYSKSLGDDGAQLCDYRAGYGLSNCYIGAGRCPGAYFNRCHPDNVWSMELSSTYAYYLTVDSGSARNDNNYKSHALSVRCIVPMATTGACTASECGCPAGYYTSGTACKICEAGYYCTNGSSKSQCTSGKYSKPGATASSECFSCPTNCVACSDSNTCTQCAEGYELNSEGKCEKACESWQMKVNISGTDYCFTKYNVGDFVNGVGVDIPADAGVKVVKADTELCGSVNNNTTKCCWKASTTANTAGDDCNSSYGSYSGCKRTVCNWLAANAICSALGMQLATTSQLETIYYTYSKSLGNNGAQLCDSEAVLDYGSSICSVLNTSCLYSYGSQCLPYYVWSTKYDSSHSYGIYVSNGNLHLDAFLNNSGALSVRCIK